MKQRSFDFDGPRQPGLYRECLDFSEKLRSKGIIGEELTDALGIALWAYNRPPDQAEEDRLFTRYFREWGIAHLSPKT